ncbi:hypothetical protein QS468_47915 [Bacillus subtilis]|nr:hypothetical protein [Pseudomonas sp. A29(2023)]MDL5600508.1 hypothetical protein [Bacillus subtilis]
MALAWREFESLKGVKLQKWQRTFAVEAGTDRVFLSASLTGDAEHLVWMCASDDGMPVYSRDDHYYVPADWMASEFPKTKPICDLVMASLR